MPDAWPSMYHRYTMLWKMPLLLLLLVGMPFADAAALPVVYDSSSNDGTNTGIASIAPDNTSHTLNLFFDAGELSFGYLLNLQADVGFDLVSFSPDASVSLFVFVAGDGGKLDVTGGDPINGDLGSVRIGTLVVRSMTPGSALRLVNPDPNTTGPVFTDAGFNFVPIPVPQIVALTGPIPEPRASWLFAVGLLVVAGGLRRRTHSR